MQSLWISWFGCGKKLLFIYLCTKMLHNYNVKCCIKVQNHFLESVDFRWLCKHFTSVRCCMSVRCCFSVSESTGITVINCQRFTLVERMSTLRLKLRCWAVRVGGCPSWGGVQSAPGGGWVQRARMGLWIRAGPLAWILAGCLGWRWLFSSNESSWRPVEGAVHGADAMWFLPSALKVKVKKFQ